MSIVFTLVKKSNRVSFIQKRKITFFTAIMQGVWPKIFIGSFPRTFTENTDLRTFISPCIWFALFAFLKSILVNAVTAGDLAKFLMQTFARQKQKAAASAIINLISAVVWAFVFRVSRNLKSKASNLVLDLFTQSVFFYNVSFSWCIFIAAEKIFLSINIICFIFRVFPFWCFIRIHTH